MQDRLGEIQPTNGNTYNWAPKDAAIAIAAGHCKKLCISIAAGFSTLSWVYTNELYKYHVTEIAQTPALGVRSTVLWDTVYQA